MRRKSKIKPKFQKGKIVRDLPLTPATQAQPTFNVAQLGLSILRTENKSIVKHQKGIKPLLGHQADVKKCFCQQDAIFKSNPISECLPLSLPLLD